MSGAREGQELGPYRLLHRIGSGGLGEVWLAHDVHLLRKVAVRILPERVAGNAEARVRVVREARAVAQLTSPSIASIFSVEDDLGCLFIASELVEGKPLGVALAEGTLSDYDVVRIGRDIAEALGEAHDKAIAHHAIRANNVILSAGRVKILDFGLAPLRAGGGDDLVSLGMLLSHALAPAGENHASIAQRRADLPNELAAAIDRCIRRGFASAHEVAIALERLLPRLSRTALPATPSIELVPQRLDVRADASEAKCFLIADDDPAMRRLFEVISRRTSLECDTAANGPEAIAALKRRRYDLLFLDIMMPRIDGWGVLDYLRTRATHELPTIFIVTSFIDQMLSAADSEIVAGIIYKPFDADEIATLMRDAARGETIANALHKTRHRLFAAAG
jgi:CheY-like chemotaxis protein